ncbi:sigma-70 family RNA polymerase sigma factor [Agaribacter flavus]|uniref:RNA polymerase sigma factor n=1 Tax=Agaribacter flavus TaxID=1902781 RepID=A0ABV7FV93_9ALTE
MFHLIGKLTRNKEQTDTALVLACLGGNRDAFTSIVVRYQTLLCTIAYAAIGDIKHSEDLAQEAFVEAWRKLDNLREPEKLKSWLCGILRFKINHFLRKEAKQIVNDADELTTELKRVSNEAKLEDAAISAQEQAILWQALAHIPETYREPLVLFYREHNSVQAVALKLDLSEEAAKQRLSRGRKLLQKAVQSMVERSLKHTRSGTAFTLAVLASINMSSPPAKAAMIGAGSVKAASTAKWMSLAPVLAIFSGFISAFFGLRAGLDQARTRNERKRVILFTVLFFLFAGVYVSIIFVLKHLAMSWPEYTHVALVLSQILTFSFLISYLVLTFKMVTGTRKLRAFERQNNAHAFTQTDDENFQKKREYKSVIRLAGIPLIHIRFGMPEEGDTPVNAWIAGGELAFGRLIAWGGVAVAPISVGIVSLGVISIGAVSIGLLSLGTITLGLIGFGASAIAYKAYASLSALGWQSAFSNAFSIANEAAIGPISQAKHVNSELAAELTNINVFAQHYSWILLLMSIAVIVPSIWYSIKVRERLKLP